MVDYRLIVYSKNTDKKKLKKLMDEAGVTSTNQMAKGKTSDGQFYIVYKIIL